MSRVTLERDAHIVSRTAKYKPIIKYTIVMLVVRLLVIHLLISSSLCLLSFRKGSHFGSNRALHAIRPKEISLEVPDVEKFMEFYQTALKLPKESIDKLRFTNDVVMKLSTWKPTPVAEKFQPEVRRIEDHKYSEDHS